MIYLEGAIHFLLAVIPAVATGFIGYLFNKIKRRDDQREVDERKRANDILNRERATNEALRALCRDRILQGYRYYKANNGVSTAELETMTKLYNAYHGLGGNGTISAVYDKICALPLKGGD